jgi:hypothetical protein
MNITVSQIAEYYANCGYMEPINADIFKNETINLSGRKNTGKIKPTKNKAKRDRKRLGR